MSTESVHKKTIQQPKHEPDTHALPSAVTFYMSVQERRGLLNALKPIDQSRSQAILIAMGLKKNNQKESHKQRPKHKTGHTNG